MPRHDYKGRAELAGIERDFQNEAAAKSLDGHKHELARLQAELRDCPDNCVNVQSYLCQQIMHTRNLIKAKATN